MITAEKRFNLQPSAFHLQPALIMPTIQTHNLTKKFGDLTAVDALTISVGQGELFGLVGSDGAGKTTTMRMLTAIMEPTSGDAWVMGHHVVSEAEAIKEEI